MQKCWVKLLRGAIYVICIACLCKMYYDQGMEDYKRNRYEWYNETTYIQNPPTIMTGCWQTCDLIEDVSWEEYVRRYQERMLPQ